MTAKSTPTITLADDPADTTARFRREIQQLEATRTKVESDAIKSDDTGYGAQKLARLEDDLRLAHAKFTAAERAEEAAAAKIGDPSAIVAALAEFEADPALAVDATADAIAALEQAVADYFAATDQRDAALAGWRARFTALGIPQSGLSVDGDPVSYGPYEIAARGGLVSSIDHPANFLTYVIERGSEGRQVTGKQDPRTSLRHHDSRAATVEHLTIKLTTPLGGNPIGRELSTRHGRTRGTLEQLVRNGHATVAEGQVKEPAKVA